MQIPCTSYQDEVNLPRDLRIGYFVQIRMEGLIELQSLPEKIEEFSASSNATKGIVSLIGLPRSLRVLCLRNNYIEAFEGYAGSLPDTLEHISIHHRDGNLPKTARYIPLDEKKPVDQRVHMFEEC